MRRRLRPLVAVTMACALALAAVACGGNDGGGGAASDDAASGGATTASTQTRCGDGTGEKATGTPIKLGAIATKIPGLDLTEETDAAQAFFTCVNDNGGIKGHPVDLLVEQHASDPQQVASLATKLGDSEKVDAFVAGMSILDCPVNAKYYATHGYWPILAAATQDCFQTPSIAALNLGPLYSSLGAVQYLVDHAGAKGTIVIVSQKQPGFAEVNDGALSYAKEKGFKTVSRLETIPISDPASLAQALVAQAGDGGGVVVDFGASEAVKVLQAAAQQGLIDRVKWGAPTTLNDTSVPDALGSQWDGKIFINAELAMLDSDGPDMRLYRAVNQRYNPKRPLSSFGQMGFVAAKMFTDTVSKLPEDQLTKEGINDALLNVKNYTTDIICKPWYFQRMKLHVPNNTDRTVTLKDGKMREIQGCTEVADSYPDLKYVRAYEASHDVNTG